MAAGRLEAAGAARGRAPSAPRDGGCPRCRSPSVPAGRGSRTSTRTPTATRARSSARPRTARSCRSWRRRGGCPPECRVRGRTASRRFRPAARACVVRRRTRRQGRRGSRSRCAPQPCCSSAWRSGAARALPSSDGLRADRQAGRTRPAPRASRAHRGRRAGRRSRFRPEAANGSGDLLPRPPPRRSSTACRPAATGPCR